MLAPWKKKYDKPRQHIKKQRHHFANKVCLVKAIVFPVVYGCESWTIKKVEHQRIHAFELWHWRRLLRVPQTARRSHKSILKEISPEYSLEGLMLKLKFQYFGYLVQRANSLEKTLMLGKIEGRQRRGQEDEMVGWHHQLNGHEFEQTLGDSKGLGSLACCSPQGHKESDITEQLNKQSLTIPGKDFSFLTHPLPQGVSPTFPCTNPFPPQSISAFIYPWFWAQYTFSANSSRFNVWGCALLPETTSPISCINICWYQPAQ